MGGGHTVCMALSMESLLGGTGSAILGFTHGNSGERRKWRKDERIYPLRIKL